MRVRKTSGKQAGLVVDLPQHAAEAELAFGTAERVAEEPTAPVSTADETTSDGSLDTRTHNLKVKDARTLIAAIDSADELTRLYEGEEGREKGSRKGVLDAIEERLGELAVAE